jgi:uncharacterized protein YndB with AHSA1/START domain
MTTPPRISVVIPVTNAPADGEDTFRAVVTGTEIEQWLGLMSLSDGFDARPVGSYRIHAKAAATGLADVTVRDFLHTARLREARESASLRSTCGSSR